MVLKKLTSANVDETGENRSRNNLFCDVKEVSDTRQTNQTKVGKEISQTLN